MSIGLSDMPPDVVGEIIRWLPEDTVIHSIRRTCRELRRFVEETYYEEVCRRYYATYQPALEYFDDRLIAQECSWGKLYNITRLKNPVTTFAWIIPNFMSIKANKLYSNVFTYRGNNWSILMFPHGMPPPSLKAPNAIGLFLMPLDDSERIGSRPELAHKPPKYSWCDVQFTMKLGSSVPGRELRRGSSNTFRDNGEHPDWGFHEFIRRDKLEDHISPDGTLTIEVTLKFGARLGPRRLDFAIKTIEQSSGLPTSTVSRHLTRVVNEIYRVPYVQGSSTTSQVRCDRCDIMYQETKRLSETDTIPLDAFERASFGTRIVVVCADDLRLVNGRVKDVLIQIIRRLAVAEHAGITSPITVGSAE